MADPAIKGIPVSTAAYPSDSQIDRRAAIVRDDDGSLRRVEPGQWFRARRTADTWAYWERMPYSGRMIIDVVSFEGQDGSCIHAEIKSRASSKSARLPDIWECQRCGYEERFIDSMDTWTTTEGDPFLASPNGSWVALQALFDGS